MTRGRCYGIALHTDSTSCGSLLSAKNGKINSPALTAAQGSDCRRLDNFTREAVVKQSFCFLDCFRIIGSEFLPVFPAICVNGKFLVAVACCVEQIFNLHGVGVYACVKAKRFFVGGQQALDACGVPGVMLYHVAGSPADKLPHDFTVTVAQTL